MKSIVFYFLLILTIFSLRSQTKAETNFGSWYIFHGNHKTSKNWSINYGFQERNYEAFKNYNLFIIYTGINYKLNNNWTANVSYGYLDIDRTFDPDINPNTIEHRVYEQISYKTRQFIIPFFHRIRLEHRNLYSMEKYSLINRIRYRLKTKVPFKNKIYVNISNESFFNFKGNLYSENRFYSALGFKFNKTITLEIGYLNQYINKQHLNRLQIGLLLKTGY
jgi:hypothetical protein